MPPDGESGRAARFAHILVRLQELPNYVWDPEIEPFHSVGAGLPISSVASRALTTGSRTTTGISSATKSRPRGTSDPSRGEGAASPRQPHRIRPTRRARPSTAATAAPAQRRAPRRCKHTSQTPPPERWLATAAPSSAACRHKPCA